MTTSNATPWLVLGTLIVLSGLLVSQFSAVPTSVGDDSAAAAPPAETAAPAVAETAEAPAIADAAPPPEEPAPAPEAAAPPPPLAVAEPAPIDPAPAAAAAPPAAPVAVQEAPAKAADAASGPRFEGSLFGAAGTTFSGRGTPGSVMKLYVDGQAIGLFSTAKNGKWYFRTKAPFAPGAHQAKLNELAADGTVVTTHEASFEAPAAP